MKKNCFVCVNCGHKISESKRIYVDVDWCGKCIDADHARLKPKTGYLWKELSGHVLRPKG